MDTIVEITVATSSEVLAREAIRDAMAEMKRIDDQLSHVQPGNQLSNLNRDGSNMNVSVSKELFDILCHAVELSKASDGAFDVTISPVLGLWEFDTGGHLPRQNELDAMVQKVGFEYLLMDNNARSVGYSLPEMRIDLGAIAKGWAVDRAMEKIVARGVRNAIVDAGGDLRVAGTRPGKSSWRIGVQHPREAGTLLASFDLSDTAIATSGDYERFFTIDGVRYHHILDPASGQPARGCQSVTVLAATAAEADACATAAFVLGPEKGLAFLRGRNGVRGLIVDAAGEVHWTDPALERMARR